MVWCVDSQSKSTGFKTDLQYSDVGTLMCVISSELAIRHPKPSELDNLELNKDPSLLQRKQLGDR
jgi:hypothetical protein